MVSFLTEDKIAAGKCLVEALDAAGFGITAAYWFRDEESETWKLALSEKHLTDVREFYRRVQKVISSVANCGISLDEVSAMPSKSKLIRLLSSFIRTGKGMHKIQASGDTVDGVLLPDMLIYRVA